MILRQPARGYRLTSDAVLLAALTPLRAGQKILELGTGYGQVALCLLAREPVLSVTGLEMMPAAADLARQNAELNGVADRFRIVEGNVQDCVLTGFDVVVTNPPYRQSQSHTASGDPLKAAATIEQVPLRVWLECAARALLPEGQLVLIHDARRAAELFSTLEKCGLPDRCLLPLLSRSGEPAKRVVIRARRGEGRLHTCPPLVLHEADGSWCAQAARVLRQPEALPLWPD